jgi:hypothetical protein
MCKLMPFSWFLKKPLIMTWGLLTEVPGYIIIEILPLDISLLNVDLILCCFGITALPTYSWPTSPVIINQNINFTIWFK